MCESAIALYGQEMAAGLTMIVTPRVQIAPEIAAAKAGLVVEGKVDTSRF